MRIGVLKAGMRKRLWLAAFILATFISKAALADERQYKIETAYLYSFFNYITWPGFNSPQDLKNPTICISGEDPIIPYLGYISNKVARERTLTIRPLTDGSSANGCHIFFIRHRISAQMVDSLRRDTLIVFKSDDPLDRGGMIELSEDGERIAIKINQVQLEERGFQVSSRLLELAQGGR